jgi:hypothetical protein
MNSPYEFYCYSCGTKLSVPRAPKRNTRICSKCGKTRIKITERVCLGCIKFVPAGYSRPEGWTSIEQWQAREVITTA